MATKLDLRQSVSRSALNMAGTPANGTADLIVSAHDAELGKLFEDRNVILQNGGIITFTGTQIQFTENLEIVINQKISGAAPQVISLGSANVNLANLDMWYAVVDRGAGTATTFVAATLPAVSNANQEVFLIVKRVDAGDGTQRVYWRSGMAQDAGQSNRLGASGSGSGGSGAGDDLNALLYRASFQDNFDEGPSDSKSAVNITAGFTDSTAYSAAKKMYVLNYDASKTIAAATTTTTINLSANASFTVKIGDVVIANNQARRITAVGSQSSFTTEAFTVAPTLASQVTVSQAVHTKDVYNLAVDGNALSAAFSGETFQDVLLDYEDTTTAGDNIFDVNVAPVIGYDAGNDGTTFTDVNIRPTLETTTIESVLLPSAGTGLYVRLFAYKQSGSGTVNVLRWKGFMQKTTVATAGGIVNTAYAFTDGVGTPINCTVGVSGGKTTITFDWQYAMDVLENTTASSIEVWLNGSKIPRFVDSTLTPDASFLETSSSIITLDRDYSSQNLSVEVFQRTAIIDNTDQNSTNIQYLQEIQQNGFQSFVAQNLVLNAVTSTGTPVAGSFHSTIVNRASIPDLSQNLKAAMGIERIATHQAFQLQNEFGANGETVHGIVGDFFNQVRLVGGWTSTDTSSGVKVDPTTATTDYIEVVFYGTGLNIITATANDSRDLRASTDGGAEGSNLFTVTGTNVLSARGYGSNVVLPAVSGLSLGVHTVRIRSANGTNAPSIYGFEILNVASTINVNSGISFVNGSKLVTLASQALAYNSTFESGTLGTRGGRVVIYQKLDGSIAKAVQPAGSQLNLTAASHTNEEVVRTHHWREFGASRTDDFSIVGAAGLANRAFTLDNGTTTLGGNQVNIVVGNDTIFPGTTGSFLVITFVGTGLDIMEVDSATGTLDSHTVTVDGVSIGTITGTATTTARQTKIVSGLPYGTHSVRITRPAAVNQAVGIKQVIVYQPKKPTIPTSAFELADYNVLADYDSTGVTGTAVTDNHQIPQGTLFKTALREMSYSGAGWAVDGAVGPNLVGGFAVNTATNTQLVSYTFFGTGFLLHTAGSAAGTYDYTITIDGVLNAAGVVKTSATNLGGGSYRCTTVTGDTPSRVEFTGLSLGLHTVTMTKSAGAGNMRLQGFHIITPIHSAKSNSDVALQNNMPVGSCAINDSRNLSAIKEPWLQRGSIATAFGVTSNPTTTSTAPTPLPDMFVVHTNESGKVRFSFSGSLTSNSAGNGVEFSIYVDGRQVINFNSFTNNSGMGSVSVPLTVSPGTHFYQVYWDSPAGTTMTAQSTSRVMSIEEIG